MWPWPSLIERRQIFLLLFLLYHLSSTSLSLSWTDCHTNNSKESAERDGSLNLKEKDKRGNKHQQIWIKSMKSSCHEPENITKFTKLFLPSHCWVVIIASFWPAHIPLSPANGLAFFNTSVFLPKTSTNPLGLNSSNVKSIRMMLKNKNKGGKSLEGCDTIFDMKQEQKKRGSGKGENRRKARKLNVSEQARAERKLNYFVDYMLLWSCEAQIQKFDAEAA